MFCSLNNNTIRTTANNCNIINLKLYIYTHTHTLTHTHTAEKKLSLVASGKRLNMIIMVMSGLALLGDNWLEELRFCFSCYKGYVAFRRLTVMVTAIVCRHACGQENIGFHYERATLLQVLFNLGDVRPLCGSETADSQCEVWAPVVSWA